MACGFDVPDGRNDEGSGDFVELTTTERGDDISLKAALFVHVGDDAAALEVAPKAEGILKDVATRRLLPYGFSLSAGLLTGLHQGDLGPSPEAQISNHASV